MDELLDIADSDDDSDGGVLDGLTGSTITDKRLTQIERGQTQLAHRLHNLAAHLGAPARP